jgi:hypothetical protein
MKLRLSVDNTDELWMQLKEKMGREAARKKNVFDLRPGTFLKIAASVMLLAVVVYFLSRPARVPEPPENSAMITLVSRDSVMRSYLPDSSVVWLNVGSSLSYAKNFGGQSRETQLKGEAYFQVKQDENSPFSVSAGDATVRVSGTSFNLNESDSMLVLTVVSGNVNFADAQGNNTTVSAGERLAVKKGHRAGKMKNNDPAFEAWRRVNNPEFDRERAEPAKFLHVNFTWRKNMIRQSVVEGTLANRASLASYRNIVLRITYTRAKKGNVTVRTRIDGAVRVGDTIRFQKRLSDILTQTQAVTVAVESASIADPPN